MLEELSKKIKTEATNNPRKMQELHKKGIIITLYCLLSGADSIVKIIRVPSRFNPPNVILLGKRGRVSPGLVIGI